ncbi:MAG TPA: hypothetical protein VG206_03600 [Terriglobia bacterium]|nr:hypothetical protein [Terriglobia bacterium]
MAKPSKAKRLSTGTAPTLALALPRRGLAYRGVLAGQLDFSLGAFSAGLTSGFGGLAILFAVMGPAEVFSAAAAPVKFVPLGAVGAMPDEDRDKGNLNHKASKKRLQIQSVKIKYDFSTLFLMLSV